MALSEYQAVIHRCREQQAASMAAYLGRLSSGRKTEKHVPDLPGRTEL